MMNWDVVDTREFRIAYVVLLGEFYVEMMVEAYLHSWLAGVLLVIVMTMVAGIFAIMSRDAWSDVRPLWRLLQHYRKELE
jgi:hypothetical protein